MSKPNKPQIAQHEIDEFRDAMRGVKRYAQTARGEGVGAKSLHVQTAQANDAHAKNSHAKSLHAQTSHAKDSHAKSLHVKTSRAKDAHAKSLHAQTSHAKDSHAKSLHAKNTRTKTTHTQTTRTKTTPAKTSRTKTTHAPSPRGALRDRTADGDYVEFARAGQQSRVLRQLKRGGHHIAATLDLHERTTAEAETMLDSFLRRAPAGKSTLLIIHGKGLHSGGRGVMKQFAINWLKQRAEVKAFCSAVQRDGGTGAVYVLAGRGRG